MTAPPRIVLHIGAPKTGSTYLQKRLRIAPEVLRRHGIYVPVLPVVARMAGNAKLLPVALDRDPSPSFRRAFPGIDVSGLDPAQVAAALIADWRSERETLLLSAENLRLHHAQEVRDLLPAGVSCAVVLFVRRQDDWVDSYYNQLIKTQDIHEDMGSFVARLCDTVRDSTCRPDWHAHHRAWSDAFGRCEVVFYDEVRSDLFAAFLAAAGLETIPELPEIERAQVSLDIYQLAYLLQLEKETAFPDFARRRAAGEEASRRLGPRGTRSLLSPTDRQRLRDRFEPTNRRLMTALGSAGRRDVLEIEAESPDYCDLRQLYESPAYARYRELADAIYSGEGQESIRAENGRPAGQRPSEA